MTPCVSPLRAVRALGVLLLLTSGTLSASATADEAAPFAALPGRWAGQGRLGLGDGKIENVTCRATYFVAADGLHLDQNVRCASSGAKVEVKSAVTYDAGKLTGTWSELMYNKNGELSGQVTPRGYHVQVKGEDLGATMEIIVRDNKQIIEINFNSSTLVGLTLVLEKG